MHKRRLGDYYTDVLQQELNEIKEPEEIYYHIEFQDETKREVNPFKLRNFLSDECNQKVEELTTDSKNGFSFKVKPILQLNLLSDIKKFEDFSCEITFHKLLNQTKGIIYLQNCEFNEEFKRTLKEAYPFIENAIETSFIKSKKSNATAVLLTFNLQEQPYNLYIPGRPSNTAVYKYQARPMIGHKCHRYGHTKTRCRRKAVCRNFGEDDHTSDKTNKSPN